MNSRITRISKEARPLLWPWCLVAITSLVPLIPRIYLGAMTPLSLAALYGFSSLAFYVGIPLLVALPLGNEFQHGTLSLLLSQPVDRMRIWGEKLGVTIIAAISIFGLLGALRHDWFQLQAGLWVVVTICSAAFWTLRARSTVGGLLLSLFSVIFVVYGVAALAYRILERPAPTESAFAALCYAGVMLWLGRRELSQFQMTGGTGSQDLLMTGPNMMPVSLAGWFRCRPAGATLNLIRKELRLLRLLWLITLLFVLFWTCLSITFRFAAGVSNILSILLVGVYAPLMLVLAGSLSLGEEKTLGTKSWHMTLPVPALRQWLIKLVIAIVTGFVSGVLIPLLMVFASQSLLASPFGEDFRMVLTFPDLNSTMVSALVLLLLTFGSFWCACAGKDTLRASLSVFPLLVVLLVAVESGSRVAQNLHHASFGLRSLSAADHVGMLWLIVPALLVALYQSYRLYRTEPENLLGYLLRLAGVAFFCSFSLEMFG